ncbi:MAG: hypothetical protein DRO23_05650 [Thermoprotei archaeon]|nr:MAG: hypothetical protein DRO23_05650 [Thermoprotei archaeon]
MSEWVKQREEELRRYIKRGMILLIYDELEKTRRYWGYRFQYLVANGLEAKYNSEITVGKNRLQLIITIDIPEEFMNKAVEDAIRRRERSVWKKSMWGEEIRGEEYLKKQEEEDKELEEVEIVEGT